MRSEIGQLIIESEDTFRRILDGNVDDEEEPQAAANASGNASAGEDKRAGPGGDAGNAFGDNNTSSAGERDTNMMDSE